MENWYQRFTSKSVQLAQVYLCFLLDVSNGILYYFFRGIAIEHETRIVAVCDSSNHRIQFYDHQLHFLRSLGSYGSSRSEFDCPAGVCINKHKQCLVSDR